MAKAEKFLSRFILVQSLVLSLFAFILLPILLDDNSNNDLSSCNIRTVIEQNGDSLPIPTGIAMKFTDIGSIRILIVSLFIASVLILEVKYRESKAKDIYYSIYSIFCFAIGFIFLSAILLPFIPLC